VLACSVQFLHARRDYSFQFWRCVPGHCANHLDLDVLEEQERSLFEETLGVADNQVRTSYECNYSPSESTMSTGVVVVIIIAGERERERERKRERE